MQQMSLLIVYANFQLKNERTNTRRCLQSVCNQYVGKELWVECLLTQTQRQACHLRAIVTENGKWVTSVLWASFSFYTLSSHIHTCILRYFIQNGKGMNWTTATRCATFTRFPLWWPTWRKQEPPQSIGIIKTLWISWLRCTWETALNTTWNDKLIKKAAGWLGGCHIPIKEGAKWCKMCSVVRLQF